MSDEQRCPRRHDMQISTARLSNEDFDIDLAYKQAIEEGEKLDVWQVRGEEDFRRCSYCGGIHPEDAVELVERGWMPIPTDKGYKLYLRAPDGRRHEEGAFKLYRQHFLHPEMPNWQRVRP